MLQRKKPILTSARDSETLRIAKIKLDNQLVKKKKIDKISSLAINSIKISSLAINSIFFLCVFSFTSIHDSQDSRGRGRLFF